MSVLLMSEECVGLVVGSCLECEEGSATSTVQPLLETFDVSIYHSN